MYYLTQTGKDILNEALSRAAKAYKGRQRRYEAEAVKAKLHHGTKAEQPRTEYMMTPGEEKSLIKRDKAKERLEQQLQAQGKHRDRSITSKPQEGEEWKGSKIRKKDTNERIIDAVWNPGEKRIYRGVKKAKKRMRQLRREGPGGTLQ